MSNDKGTRRGNQDGTIYQRPDGTWQARTPRLPDAPVRTKTSRSKSEVAEWLADQLADGGDAGRIAAIEASLAVIDQHLRGIQQNLAEMSGRRS